MANILLVEPDLILADTYSKALEAAGHQVVIATGAQMGVIVADNIQPDVVLLELQLVEHSGIEFLYEFRSYPDWQNIPVLIHSHVPPAEFSGSWPLLHNQLGVTAYLYKPQISLRQLLKSVNEQLAVTA